MDINELIEQFMQYKCIKLKEGSIKNYRGRLDVFCEFIKPQIAVAGEAILRGFDKNSMKKAMEFYKKERNVMYKATMNLYVSTIREFFKFLIQKETIDNPTFGAFLNKEEFDEYVREIVDNEMKLKEGDDSLPLTDEEVIALIRICNKEMNFTEDEVVNFRNTRKDPYIRYLSAVAIKVTLFTGVKLENLYEIKHGDFHREHNTLLMNNYRLNLPNELSCQIRKLLDIQSKLFQDCTQDSYLFVNRNGERIMSGSVLFRVLNNMIGSSSSAKVNLYVIPKMIERGMNVKMMMELTGCTFETYECCQEMIDVEYCQKDRSRYLSAKLRSIDLFDEL